MSDERLIRLDNLRRVMAARTLSIRDLVGLLGSRYSYWRDLLEDTGKSFGEKIARRIEAGLGLPRYWLDTPQTAVPQSFSTSAMQPTRRVGVFGQATGGIWPERIWTDGDQLADATDQFADVTTSDREAFVCKVAGNSMAPRFQPGEYALIEPNTVADIEDDVLVRLVSGHTMLKRLLSRRGGIRLGSYNESEVITLQSNEITWMYYVAHALPAKKIRDRISDDPRDAPATGPGQLDGLDE